MIGAASVKATTVLYVKGSSLSAGGSQSSLQDLVKAPS